MDPITAMLIFGGVSTLAGMAGNWWQNRQQKKQNELAYQREINLYQKDKEFQLDMWNRNNQYNSPVAQIERLKAAGVNPNLAFGSGSFSQAQSTPVSTLNPRVPKPDITGMLEHVQQGNFMDNLAKFQNIKLMKEQEGLVKANKAYTDAKAINEGMRSNLIDTDTKQKILNYQTSSILQRTQIDAAQTQLEYTKKQLAEMAWNVRNQKLRRGIMEEDLLDKQLENELNMGLKPYGADSRAPWYIKMILKQYDKGNIIIP